MKEMVAPRPSLEKLVSEKGLSPTVEKFRDCINGYAMTHLGMGCKYSMLVALTRRFPMRQIDAFRYLKSDCARLRHR